MEEQIYDAGNAGKMEISEQSKQFLAETGKWAKFISLLGFILLGVIDLFILFIVISGSGLLDKLYPGMGMMSIPYVFMMLAVTAIYFFPLYYLYQFSVKVQHAVKLNDNKVIEESFLFLKKYYKFMGILMIVVLSLYVFALLMGLMVGAAFMRM